MLGRPTLNSDLERGVGMMVWFVDPGKERWPLIRPSQIFAVTLRTKLLIGIGASCERVSRKLRYRCRRCEPAGTAGYGEYRDGCNQSFLNTPHRYRNYVAVHPADMIRARLAECCFEITSS